MFRKFIVSFVFILTLSGMASALHLHEVEEFYVTERWLELTTTFDIHNKNNKMGTVHRKLFSLMPEYHFHDFTDRFQAKARMRFFSFGAIFDVTDEDDYLIGIVEERIWNYFPTFHILAPNGEILAIAEMNFWGTKYTITTLWYREIATLSRSFFRIKNNWTVRIPEKDAFCECNIDPRLFIVVMAFQTDMDHWREADGDFAMNHQFKFNIFGKKEKQSDNTDMEELKEILLQYRQVVACDVEPTEEDVAEVEKITDVYLRNSYRENFQVLDAEERIVIGCHSLLPLLDGDELNSIQKKALYNMLEMRLKY